MTPSEGRARRVTHNTLFLYFSDGIARLFSWATVAFLTRHWTDVGTYGQYAVAVNWISIFGVFSELGLNVLVVREVSRRKDRVVFYLRNVLALRLAFSALFWATLIGIAFAFHYEPVLQASLAVMGLKIVLDSMAGGYFYLFQAHEKMGFYSVINVFYSAFRFLGIVLVVWAGGGVAGACGVWVVASAFVFLVVVTRGAREGWKPAFSDFQVGESLAVLKQSLPLAAFGSLQMLYYRVDSVILKGLAGNEPVGYYDAAAKVLFVVLTLSQIFNMAIFPVFSSLRDDAPTFSRLAGRAIKFLGLLGMPVTVGGVLLAQPIMVLVSGGKYASSGPLFAVLCLSIFPYFLCHVYILTLAVKNTYRLNLQFLTLFVLNVALNFILIPRMGAAGASWATVLCEFFGIGLGFYLCAPYLKGLPWGRLARPALASVGASALMGVCVWTDPRLYWLVLGPLVYGLGLWAFRGLDPEDWANIRSILRLKGA